MSYFRNFEKVLRKEILLQAEIGNVKIYIEVIIMADRK